MELTPKREIELLIIGIRMQLDEVEKNVTHHDIKMREYAEFKKQELYVLWEKIERLNTETFK